MSDPLAGPGATAGSDGGTEHLGALPPRPGRLDIALVGRPNAGKSTLFNRLTGGSAHVGNFPGVTVDVLAGRVTMPSGGVAEIHDLPGLYQLDPGPGGSADERVAVDFLRARKVSGERLVVVQVLDATQLELHLRLTRQIEQVLPDSPLLLVVTQRDLLEQGGGKLDGEALGREVGATVVVVSQRDPDVRERVLGAVEKVASTDRREVPDWNPTAAARAASVEAAHGPATAQARSERIDRVLLNPVLGPLLFLLIMGTSFAAVFLIADPAKTVFDAVLGKLVEVLRPHLGDGLVSSLVIDGVIGGVGTVLSFLPQIVVLIALMDVLEGSGYLARAAFLVDRVFRAVGLGGKSFVPLLTAHACAVPAISATRTLRDPRERLTTILVLPLMSCSARLPTYTLLVAAFFGGSALRKALICTGLYMAGIASGLLAALVMRRTVTRGRGLPLLLEMPSYRVPSASATLRRCGREALDFTRRAGTVILAVSVILWSLLKVPIGTVPAGEPAIEHSAAATVGRALEPVTRPLGFDWRINIGLIGAFGAREVMVSTLGVIFGVENAEDDSAPLSDKLRTLQKPDGSPVYTAATGASLLAFFVLACQCMSTLAAVHRQTRRWSMVALVLAYTYALAYVVSLVVYQVARVLVA